MVYILYMVYVMQEIIEKTEVPCKGCEYLREQEVGDRIVYGCVRLPCQECLLEMKED